MNTYIRIISLIVIALGMSSPAFAQWYPKGNIELIVSAGPGGGNDKTARLVAKILNEKKLVSVPVIVVNKPGAGGVIAQNYLNSFPGSGNHLMVTNPALITNALTGTGTAKYTDIDSTLLNRFEIFQGFMHPQQHTWRKCRPRL